MILDYDLGTTSFFVVGFVFYFCLVYKFSSIPFSSIFDYFIWSTTLKG